MARHGLSLSFEDKSKTVNTARNTDATVEVIVRDQRRRLVSHGEGGTGSTQLRVGYERVAHCSPRRRVGQPAIPVAQARVTRFAYCGARRRGRSAGFRARCGPGRDRHAPPCAGQEDPGKRDPQRTRGVWHGKKCFACSPLLRGDGL
jgi:hypothetical protein